MNLNIRGSLGTQVMEYLYGIALSITSNEPITKIQINVRDTADHSKIDYLSQIFELDVPVEFVDDRNKMHSFRLENVQFIVKHLDAIRDKLVYKDVGPFVKQTNLLHYRNGDRQCLPDNYYKAIWQTHALLYNIIGNDDVRINQIFGRYSSALNLGNGPIKDWQTARHARLIVGGFSMFTISAFLLGSPRLCIYIDKENPVINDSDRQTLNYLSAEFTNFDVWKKEIAFHGL